MKKAFKRISKSSISLALSIVMIASSVLFTSASSADYKNDAASSVEQSTEVELYKGEGTIELEDGVSAEDFYEGKDTLNASASEEVDNAAEEISNEAAKSTSNEDEVSVKNDTAAVVATQKPQKVLPQASGAKNTKVYFSGFSEKVSTNWYTYLKDSTTYKLCVYAFDSNDAQTDGAWPGKTMTMDSDMGFYGASIDDSAVGVVFCIAKKSDDTVVAQTPGTNSSFTVTNGDVYTIGGSTSAGGSTTLYLKKPSSWSQPYAHVYANYTNKETTKWRGIKMSLVSGTTDVYSVTFGSMFNRVIFNSVDGGQTGELRPNDNKNKIYDPSTSSWSDYEAASTEFSHNL